MGDATSTKAPEAYGLGHFRAASEAFIFAARRDNGELVYLPQGQAEQARAWAKELLRCPEPDCSSPDLTTVNRSPGGRRDGYRHLVRPDVAHEPEGLLHRQGKALVARWAAGRPEIADVAVEAVVGGGVRVADVLLTLRHGGQIAVEIQYAGLSVVDFKRRSDSYSRLGIAVTWLWGHVGAHSPLQDRWRDLPLRLIRDGQPVIWLNPTEETCAWTWDAGPLRHPAQEPRHPAYTFGGLDDLLVTSTGIYPPGFQEDRDAALEAAGESRLRQEEQTYWQRIKDRDIRNAQETAAVMRRLRGSQGELFPDPNPPPLRRATTVKVCKRCGRRLSADVSWETHADPWCDR